MLTQTGSHWSSTGVFDLISPFSLGIALDPLATVGLRGLEGQQKVRYPQGEAGSGLFASPDSTVASVYLVCGHGLEGVDWEDEVLPGQRGGLTVSLSSPGVVRIGAREKSQEC